jgi:hypothetical protein
MRSIPQQCENFCFSYSIVCIFQGTTLCQASIVCIIIGLLYVSRAVYNIIAVIPHGGLPSFGYGWINVSDEVC